MELQVHIENKNCLLPVDMSLKWLDLKIENMAKGNNNKPDFLSSFTQKKKISTSHSCNEQKSPRMTVPEIKNRNQILTLQWVDENP